MAAAVAAPPAARAPRARHPARTAAPTRACAGCVAREAKALARRRGALATLSRGGSAGARAPPASRCAREDPPDADPPGGRRPRTDEPSEPSEPSESSESARDDSRPSRDRDDDPTTPSEDPDPLTRVALALIQFYRANVSPLTPPSCRFVPTCSQYGMTAFREFGAGKGLVLTAWRILRCNPLGGRGYDPPVWEKFPVGFRATAGPDDD